MTTITEKPLLNFKEAQALTGLGRDHLLALLRSREIKSFRMGEGVNCAYRIPRVEVDAWIAREIDRQGLPRPSKGAGLQRRPPGPKSRPAAANGGLNGQSIAPAREAAAGQPGRV